MLSDDVAGCGYRVNHGSGTRSAGATPYPYPQKPHPPDDKCGFMYVHIWCHPLLAGSMVLGTQISFVTMCTVYILCSFLCITCDTFYLLLTVVLCVSDQELACVKN
jgi:hypothetical protein